MNNSGSSKREYHKKENISGKIDKNNNGKQNEQKIRSSSMNNITKEKESSVKMHNSERKDNREQNKTRDNKESYNNKNYNKFSSREQRKDKERRNNYKDVVQRQNVRKVRTEESIDDIKTDIQRIEKEIELELMEIRSMRLGI